MNISRIKIFCTSVAAVCLLASGCTPKEGERAKYDVHIRPGVVTYGTHSSAIVPLLSTSSHHNAAPMISGNTVRSYAHAGHASMPQTVASGGIRTTTLGTAKTSVGSVNTSSGSGGSNSATNYASARRVSAGVQNSGYTMGAVPMPMMAMTSRAYASEVSVMGESTMAEESLTGRTVSGGKMGGTPGNPGTPDNPIQPPIPVGHTPWLLMLLFAISYTLFLTKKSHQA